VSINLKNKLANIFRSQLLQIKDDWQMCQEKSTVIFSSEFYQYNSLLENAKNNLNDNEILTYQLSDEYLNSSDKGNKFIFPNTALFQIKNLLKHIEGNYKISMYPEASFINDRVLKDKYLLFLLDKKQTPSCDVLSSVTLEFEDRLRRIANLPNSCIGMDLVNKSLNPKTGKLEFKDKTAKEFEGYYNLVKGFFDFIRGKPHHVKVIIGRSELYKEIVFIDKLLNEFNNLILKK
jgi:hypothetical protein